MVAKAPNDGLHAADRHGQHPRDQSSLYARLPFDVERDFAPVTNLVRLPNLLVVNNSVPAKSCPSWSPGSRRTRQGELRIVGHGTSSHLSAVMFQIATAPR